MKKIFLALIVMLAMQSCSEKISQLAIENTNWVLTEWPGKTLPTAAKATLNFGSESKIGGKSFCNSYGGNYSLTDGTIKFDQLFSTKMFCTEFSGAENTFQVDLTSATAAKVSGNKLRLLKDGQLIMVFTKSE